jgi:rhodanese-related sulfurtransferase
MEIETERPITVDELLQDARARLERLTPAETRAAITTGAALIDIRSEPQRAHDGHVPGAHFVPRNVLEWRLDPASANSDPELARRDRLLVLMCDEGFQSSLAAATLTRLGLRATDMVGGFQAWRSAGFPVEDGD